MSGGYVIARENFKEAEKHVSAENEPVMFNLLYGLQSLTTQIEADFIALHATLASLLGPTPRKGQRPRKAPSKRARAKKPRRTR